MSLCDKWALHDRASRRPKLEAPRALAELEQLVILERWLAKPLSERIALKNAVKWRLTRDEKD